MKNTPKTPKNKNEKSNDDLIKKLKNYIRTNASLFLSDNNISSIGIGYKITDKKPTENISIQFTVDKKVKPDILESIDTLEIPKTIEIDNVTVSTDVLERKYDLSFEVIEDVSDNERKKRLDPLFPGVSICNAKGSAGTLGCIVYDKNNNTPYVLSNWHVLHGDTGEIGDLIVQPGPHDDNRTDLNICGNLVRSHLGLAGDCAISTIENRGFVEEIFKLNTNVKKLCEPNLHDKVVKSGRTTDVTYGIVNRINVVVKIYYGENTGYQEIGCFEIGVDNEYPSPDGEISKGGDSGSVWLIAENGKASGMMAGLHFAGESSNDPYEHALACYSKSVFQKLGINVTETEKLQTGSMYGFNEYFMSEHIQVPVLNDDNIAVKLNGKTKIDYTHFSLALHKKRKFAVWVAWNIDGGKIKRLNRSGFKLDSRIAKKYQIGNELYKNNDLDRGHTARRADLNWGSLPEAKQANKDSFYYTNIVPQMNDFNQSSQGGLWGKLENAVFDEAKIDDLKVSVIGGPIFQDDDRIYRGEKIPKEYFKVIIYKEDGTIKVKAFILTQNLNRLEVLELDEFRVYEAPLTEIEERCDFTFDDTLHDSEMPEQLERLSKRKPLDTLEEIMW